MQLVKKLLGKPLTTEAMDACFAQLASYAAGLGVLFLGFWKLAALEHISEVEYFFGVLLVLCFSSLCVISGHIAWLMRSSKVSGSDGPANTASGA